MALKVQEVCKLLHVSRGTVDKWIKSGELPAYKLGSLVRILYQDLEGFLGEREKRGKEVQ
jgi:excisionase family DNA binding protein